MRRRRAAAMILVVVMAAAHNGERLWGQATFPAPVIPGRREAANPESRNIRRIETPARPGMT